MMSRVARWISGQFEDGSHESGRRSGLRRLVLGVEIAHEQRHALGIHELGEDDRQTPAAEGGEQALDRRHDLARLGDFERLTGIDEAALDVDDEKRRPAGSSFSTCSKFRTPGYYSATII